MKKTLHITNGDSCSEKLKNFGLAKHILTWREMMCEGAISYEVATTDFIKLRKEFLKRTYQISYKNYEENFLSQLEKIKHFNKNDEIIIWLDFDLFSYINMLAALQFIRQQQNNFKIYITTISQLENSNLRAISSLDENELQLLFDKKIELNDDDLDFADSIWQYYCGNNPLKLKPELNKSSNFTFVSSCIRAHLERFPNIKSGLNVIELNILKLIKNNQIISQKQLLGYALQYQGYYGYNALQYVKIIKKLKPFFNENSKFFKLTENGILALEEKQNFYRDLQDDTIYGGVSKYNFLYNPEEQSLLKL
ncbi:DUF1835 domain-containing protein [Mesonia aquimarina]|uniref:DUF1835 domain-containing protein n=1 Tax=Mesonia aquimarina TaxID=1504967 RepID=UPI000EF5A775|nr:DUF1835 domain-containing protein [Mesonia aquimarina]